MKGISAAKLKEGLKEVVFSLLVAGLVLGGVRMWKSQQLLPTDGTMVAPALALTGVDGAKLNLSDLRGKPVLLHFWAPW